MSAQTSSAQYQQMLQDALDDRGDDYDDDLGDDVSHEERDHAHDDEHGASDVGADAALTARGLDPHAEPASLLNKVLFESVCFFS